MNASDFDFVSLALVTVGLFFICCATLHKKPRHILEEAFGIYKGGLRDLKSSVFKRNQVVMGYFCVVLAIIVHLFGEASPGSESMLNSLDAVSQVAVLLAVMAALCGILNYFSRLWSKSAFKRLVFEVVTEYQWPFEENMSLTKEIGKLLGIPPNDEDTVEIYVSRIRIHLNIPHPHPVPTRGIRVRRTSRIG